jgi:PST family polysaccharide transporter
MGAVQFTSLALPLIALPYLATVLGASQLGRVAFALSVAQILLIISDYGFNLSAPKAIALHRDDPKKIAEIFCAVMLVRSLLALAGFGVMVGIVFVFQVGRSELPLLLLAYAMVIGNILLPQWLFQGLEQLKVVSAVQVAGRLIAFGGLFFLVRTPADVLAATFLQAAGVGLGGILAIPLTMRALAGGRLAWPGRTALKAQLQDGWHVFISTAAINVYTTSNIFFLGLLTSPAALGQYHVAEKLIRAAQAMYGPIGNAVYPHVARIAATDKAAALQFVRALVYKIGGLFVVISITMYFSAPALINRVFGAEYEVAVPVLQILTLMLPISVIANIFAIQTLLPFGLESRLSKILLSAAIVDFLLFIPVVYWYGLLGAAWVNVAVEVFVASAALAVLTLARLNPLRSQPRSSSTAGIPLLPPKGHAE